VAHRKGHHAGRRASTPRGDSDRELPITGLKAPIPPEAASSQHASCDAPREQGEIPAARSNGAHLVVRQRAVAIYPLAAIVVRLHVQALRVPVARPNTDRGAQGGFELGCMRR
jgi:hypothetical protein